MATEAALIGEGNQKQTRSSLLKPEVPYQSTEDRRGDCLASAEELAASVVINSTCIPADICPGNGTILECGHLTAQRRSRREKEAIRKRIYHQKVKYERNALRKTVEELTVQLHELKQGNQSTSAGLVNSVWRDIAVEERENLLRSVGEQRKLLGAALAKASCITTLYKQLPVSVADHTLSSTATCSTIDSDVTIQAALLTSPPFDYTMFRGHLRRVHDSYALTDSVFTSMADGLVTSVKRRESDNEVEYFERRHKISEPFGYAHTQRTLWSLARLHHRQQDREDFGEVAGSDDVAVVRFRVVKALTTGSTVSVLKRYVARRFVEEGRTVFVWKSHSEGEGIFRGMHSDGTGWILVQPATDEEGTTEIFFYIRQAPLSFGITPSSHFQFKEFHEVLQNCLHEDITEITSSLDKQLLEDTISDIDID